MAPNLTILFGHTLSATEERHLGHVYKKLAGSARVDADRSFGDIVSWRVNAKPIKTVFCLVLGTRLESSHTRLNDRMKVTNLAI